MIQRIASVLLATFYLYACQTGSAGPQQAALVQEDVARLKAERNARRISYTEWAERTRSAARSSVPLSPDQEAAMEYRTQLARPVDAGEITPVQFDEESTRTLQQLKANRAGL